MIILSILAFLILFSVLIIVHEWGHFYAARKAGIKVEEFGLGFGKKIWSWKSGETVFSINAIPFGGFVRMLGEEERSKDPRSFEQAKLWKRMVITLAGVFMNFIFAVAALTILFTVGTNPILISMADVERAEAAGLITLGEPDENGRPVITSVKKIQKPFPQSILFAVTETFRISKAVVQKVGEIPIEIIEKGRLPEGLAGPVGIAEVTHRILPLGILALLKLTALLSISLAVINLLPIPALDGGRFLFQLVELVTFRRPSPKWENAVHMIGYILLMALLVAVTWNDIVRLFSS